MRNKKPYESFRLIKSIPSIQLFPDDLRNLDNIARDRLQQQLPKIDVNENEILCPEVTFSLQTSGNYEGIRWEKSIDDITKLEEIIKSEHTGNTLTNVEIEWKYELDIKRKEFFKTTALTRTITMVLSWKKGEIRIVGENYEWINDAYSSFQRFFKNRKTDYENKLILYQNISIFLIWFTSIMLVFLLLTLFTAQSNFEIYKNSIIVSFGILAMSLMANELFELAFKKKYPHAEIIIKQIYEEKSIFKEYIIQILLGIISSFIVILLSQIL